MVAQGLEECGGFPVAGALWFGTVFLQSQGLDRLGTERWGAGVVESYLEDVVSAGSTGWGGCNPLGLGEGQGADQPGLGPRER